MSYVISISNQKGGVAKTTTAISIAAELSKNKNSVLIIDLDPQCSATSGLGMRSKEDDNVDLYDVFFSNCSLNDIIKSTEFPNLDIAPSSSDLVSIELEIGKKPGRELILQTEIGLLKNTYDYVIIDCPPSSGLLSLNALAASNSLIIPLQAEYYALEGISSLMQTIKFVNSTINPNLNILGVIVTMFDSRTNLSVQVLEEAKKYFNELMFNSIIPRNIRISESPSHGMPICYYAPKSKGAIAYSELTQEVLERTNSFFEEQTING